MNSGRRNLVEILFPFTSPIKSVPEWSVEGLFNHVKSRPSKGKVAAKSYVLEPLNVSVEIPLSVWLRMFQHTNS